MNIETRKPIENEEKDLAEIRARALRESLVRLGRFDEERVRTRFLEDYAPEKTHVIMVDGGVAGFFVLNVLSDAILLKHLYLDEGYQSQGVGQKILNKILDLAHESKKPVRLNALVGSDAHRFYRKNGFRIVRSDGIDNFYEWAGEAMSLRSQSRTIRYSPDPADPEHYNSLRKAVGWSTYQESEIVAGLKSSLFTLYAYDDQKPIGMGRIIGDGKMVFYIQDIIVLPQYQGLGIGDEIMKRVMGFIEKHSVENSIIGLMAGVGKERFYEKLGFIKRPNERMGSGMTMWVKKSVAGTRES